MYRRDFTDEYLIESVIHSDMQKFKFKDTCSIMCQGKTAEPNLPFVTPFNSHTIISTLKAGLHNLSRYILS